MRSSVRSTGTSWPRTGRPRSEEHTSELQSRSDLVCRLLLEKKKKQNNSDPGRPCIPQRRDGCPDPSFLPSRYDLSRVSHGFHFPLHTADRRSLLRLLTELPE